MNDYIYMDTISNINNREDTHIIEEDSFDTFEEDGEEETFDTFEDEIDIEQENINNVDYLSIISNNSSITSVNENNIETNITPINSNNQSINSNNSSIKSNKSSNESNNSNNSNLSDCVICLEVKTQSTICMPFKCEHRFHKYCVNKWINYDNDGNRIYNNIKLCPICRKELKDNYVNTDLEENNDNICLRFWRNNSIIKNHIKICINIILVIMLINVIFYCTDTLLMNYNNEALFFSHKYMIIYNNCSCYHDLPINKTAYYYVKCINNNMVDINISFNKISNVNTSKYCNLHNDTIHHTNKLKYCNSLVNKYFYPFYKRDKLEKNNVLKINCNVFECILLVFAVCAGFMLNYIF